MAAPSSFHRHLNSIFIDSSPPRPPRQRSPIPTYRGANSLFWNELDPFRVSNQLSATPQQAQLRVRNPTFTLPRPMPSVNGRSIQTPRNDLPVYQSRPPSNGANIRQQERRDNPNAAPPALYCDYHELPHPPYNPPQTRENQLSREDEEIDNYFESTPDFSNFNWETLQDEPPIPSSPPRPSENTRTDSPRNNSTNDALRFIPAQVNASSTTMPPKKRQRTSASEARSPAAKRARTTAREEKKENDPNAYDLFGINDKKDAKYEEVDLVDVEGDEDYATKMKKREEEKKAKLQMEEATKPQKLATTQCIVCMDQMDDLTVTHCGHMFCSLCLHQALNLNGQTKRTCPVCRTTIASNSRTGGKIPTKSFYHIEVKLQSRSKGKKPAKV